MPLYSLKCTKCSHEFDHACKIDERLKVRCMKCNAPTDIQITSTNRDWFRPDIWEDFTTHPIEVTSKKHLRQLCKQYGVQARALD